MIIKDETKLDKTEISMIKWTCEFIRKACKMSSGHTVAALVKSQCAVIKKLRTKTVWKCGK